METNEIPPCLERTALVAGSDMMARMAAARVTVFGVGGVGSWCVEALARSGIGNITIVDPDEVAVSNINRQLPALHSTVGQPKVEVVARRIADINPAAKVTAIQGRYTPDNGASFNLAEQDFVIDAIDSLADKADLILRAPTGDGSAHSLLLLDGRGPQARPGQNPHSRVLESRRLPAGTRPAHALPPLGHIPTPQIPVRLQPRDTTPPTQRRLRRQRHLRPRHRNLRPHPRQPRHNPTLQFARLIAAMSLT